MAQKITAYYAFQAPVIGTENQLHKRRFDEGFRSTFRVGTLAIALLYNGDIEAYHLYEDDGTADDLSAGMKPYLDASRIDRLDIIELLERAMGFPGMDEHPLFDDLCEEVLQELTYWELLVQFGYIKCTDKATVRARANA